MNYTESDIDYFHEGCWSGTDFSSHIHSELNRKNGLDASFCPCMDINDVIRGALIGTIEDFNLLMAIRDFIFTVPFKDVPLFINDDDFKKWAEWRLKIGK